jgi:hypothetical protein
MERIIFQQHFKVTNKKNLPEDTERFGFMKFVRFS